MTSEELQSKTISFIRFPLIVGVVCCHFISLQNPFVFQGIEYTSNPVWFNVLISLNCMNIISPSKCFFLIAGFFFFHHGNNTPISSFTLEEYKSKLKKRVITLLIPYLLWNILFLCRQLTAFLPLPKFIFNPQERIVHVTLSSVLHAFFNTQADPILSSVTPLDSCGVLPVPIDVPLWFLRELILLSLLTPLIFYAIQKIKGWLPILIGMIWIISNYLYKGHSYLNTVFVPSCFFFSIGAYFSIMGKNIVMECRKIKYMPLLYIGLMGIDIYLTLQGVDVRTTLFYPLSILTGIIAFINVCSVLIEKDKVKVNQLLTNSVFFIYALHTAIELIIGKIIFILTGQNSSPLGMTFLYFMTIILTIGVCTGLYWLLHRFTPKICAILTGGR